MRSPRCRSATYLCLLLLLLTALSASPQTPEPPSQSTAPQQAARPEVAASPSERATVPLQGPHSGTLAQRAQSFLGLLFFIGVAFALGRARRPRLPVFWPTILWGVGLQFLFAFLVLHTAAGGFVFRSVNDAVLALLGFAEEGARFVFGDLVKNNVPVGSPLNDPLMGPIPQPTAYAHTGAFFAFNVLPTIIFFSSLSALAYYAGVMQWLVQGMAWVMQRTMRVSGAESVSATANIFLGHTEAPLFVRPFIPRATQSELMAIMVGGFANIASGVLAAYAAMLRGYVPDIAGHLLAASVISAPCSLAVAKLLLPEAERPETAGGVKVQTARADPNAVDAAARGALEGLQLALNVAAMLVAFIGLVALLNTLLGGVGRIVGVPGLSLQLLFGYGMAPLAWLTGVPWHEAREAGALLGIKTVLNEFVAYLQLASRLGSDPQFLQPRSVILIAYALCGFANFASIAIQIGSISALAPDRRGDLSRLGIPAMIGGTLASLMTASVVGILL